MGSIKFLGVLLDEYLSWKEHIRYTENKVTKSFGLLYRAKPIHSHLLNYRSLSWVSASRINLKKLLSQHKHEIRFFNNKTLFEHAKELFNSKKMLNIYKLNILKTANFMENIYNETAPATFLNFFRKSLIVSNRVFKTVLQNT